jgi:hypothetical protein
MPRRAASRCESTEPGIFVTPICETCGNAYDKCFTVTLGGVTHTYDSFECAIYALAPACEHCGCRIIGHGMELSGRFYCCAHCAHMAGAMDLKDRAQIGPRDPAVAPHDDV